MVTNRIKLNELDIYNPDNRIEDNISDEEYEDTMEEYNKQNLNDKPFTIDDITSLISESIKNVLNEKFKSKKLDRLNREHGGLKYPYYDSELSDDEIGDVTDKVTPYDIQFKDGSRVSTNLSPEHRRMWTSKNPEQDRRMFNNRTTDGAKEYRWSNRDAGTMVQNAKPNSNGKYEIHHSWKEETPMDRLVGRNGNGDPLNNWEQHFEDGNYSVNASAVRKAKADYATRKMTPNDRHQYYRNKFGNRLIDHNEN